MLIAHHLCAVAAPCGFSDIHIPLPRIAVKLNANRHVTGVLRGFDQFMNLVLDGTVDEKGQEELGMVVLRGNSIITIEALEPVDKS